VVQTHATATWDRGGRYLSAGSFLAEDLIWQDPNFRAVNHKLIDAQDIAALKAKILTSGLSISELVSTAWASASTFPRIRQTRRREWSPEFVWRPQKDWES